MANRKSSSSRNEKLPKVAEPQRRSISAIFGQTSVATRPNKQYKPFPNQAQRRATARIACNRLDSAISPTHPKIGGSQLQDYNHTFEEVPMMLQACYEFNSVSYSTRGNYAPPSKKKEYFEAITAILSQNNNLEELDATTSELLLDVIERNVIRPIPELPKSFIFGDSPSIITLQQWPTVYFAHRLFLFVLQNYEHAAMARFLTNQFCHALIELFESPDKNEQESLTQIIGCIYEIYPETRSFLFRYLLNKVIAHLDKTTTYICVSPILSFFTSYFKMQSISWNVGYEHIFRTFFFPLFSTDYVTEFYQTLSALCSLFYIRDPKCPIWALNYLLNHWPKTNSSKQVVYLHQISAISPFLRVASVDNIYCKLFSKIGKSIISPNFKVCSAALRLCSDSYFLCCFTQIFQVVIPPLIAKLDQVTHHWNEDIRIQTTEAKQLVTNINSRLEPITTIDKTILEKRTNTIWLSIAQVAKGNDINFTYQPKPAVDLLHSY